MTRTQPRPEVAWPDGKRFAFTIFDDTDGTTLLNGPPVYDALTRHGLRITKSVWIDDTPQPSPVGGTSCADADYLAWVLELQEAGHEIGFHNARDHPSTRLQTIAALDRFRSVFGHDPRIGADHSHNLEALYWGERRLTGWRSELYRRAMSISRPHGDAFAGEVPDSPYFWADVCRDRITYWRNFTFDRLNLLDVCPQLPYHDPRRPYVNWWFSGSDAPNLDRFVELVSPANLDRLEQDGGACIIYTHLGVGFAPDGRLDARFVSAIEDIAGRDGWFAPASDVLDVLRSHGGDHLLTDRQRSAMERRWIVDLVRSRGLTEVRRAARRLR